MKKKLKKIKMINRKKFPLRAKKMIQIMKKV